MSVKTITLDMEAYELLRRRKRGRQSFSQVVKEHFGAGHTIDEFRGALLEWEVSDELLDHVDEQIDRRQDELAQAPEL